MRPLCALPTIHLLAMRRYALPALRDHIERLLRSRGVFLPIVIRGVK